MAKMMQKKYGPYQLGRECGSCKGLFLTGAVCPTCGSVDLHEDEVVRNTWMSPPGWLNMITLGTFCTAGVLEKKKS